VNYLIRNDIVYSVVARVRRLTMRTFFRNSLSLSVLAALLSLQEHEAYIIRSTPHTVWYDHIYRNSVYQVSELLYVLCKLTFSVFSFFNARWTQSIKYLGVHVASGKTLSFDVSPIKRAFYAACNSIFANTDGLNEMALLSLQEAYSLSVLVYVQLLPYI